MQLQALLAANLVPVSVLTQPDRPAGRGMKTHPNAVAKLAKKHNLLLLQPPHLRGEATLQTLTELRPQLLVSAAYGRLLPPELLALPSHGCLNVHASLLPKYRGAAPIVHALLNGDSHTGVSFMLMDEGLDTGAVLRQHKLKIAPTWNAGELTDALTRLSAKHLPALIADWMAGQVQPKAQQDEYASYAGLIRKQDAHLDWQLPATQLARTVRAYCPAPGAWCETAKGRLKILTALPLPAPANYAPMPAGQVFYPGRARIAVTCADGALELLQLQWPGGRVLSASEARNGQKAELADGTLLPATQKTHNNDYEK